MTRHTLLRASAFAAVLAALSGCGKMGDLERPGPLFGGNSTTRQADEAARQTQEPGRPVNTVDPRDRNTDPAPNRTIPLPGLASDPAQPAPQGVLPDPYANPRR